MMGKGEMKRKAYALNKEKGEKRHSGRWEKGK